MQRLEFPLLPTVSLTLLQDRGATWRFDAWVSDDAGSLPTPSVSDRMKRFASVAEAAEHFRALSTRLLGS